MNAVLINYMKMRMVEERGVQCYANVPRMNSCKFVLCCVVLPSLFAHKIEQQNCVNKSACLICRHQTQASSRRFTAICLCVSGCEVGTERKRSFRRQPPFSCTLKCGKESHFAFSEMAIQRELRILASGISQLSKEEFCHIIRYGNWLLAEMLLATFIFQK